VFGLRNSEVTGSGNWIGVREDGFVCLLDHDTNEVVVISSSFEEFVTDSKMRQAGTNVPWNVIGTW
jgi:hypothetical protein